MSSEKADQSLKREISDDKSIAGKPGNTTFDTHDSGSGDVIAEKEDHHVQLNDNVNARLANPLGGLTKEQLYAGATDFCLAHGLDSHLEVMKRAALVAQEPDEFESLAELDETEKRQLREEVTHKWKHPKKLYQMVILNSLAAAVQGWDETAINGALLIFPAQFGIGDSTDRSSWLQGLVGSAPYIACAFVGCWLTDPLNHYFGRRGTIFITALISALSCVWSGVTNSWQHLFVSRFVLGLGIGPKSATVPTFTAECAPPLIRGALIMSWQCFTAFGIMMGYIADVALYYVPDSNPNITGLNWRLMLGAASLPAFVVLAQVFFVPESPRWLMKKGRYEDALQAFLKYRNSEIQACRDLYLAYVLLNEESKIQKSSGIARWAELFTVPRNARATWASTIVMFGQQFCGVNVIAYYSSSILKDANFSDIQALLGSFGFGALNFVFAFPAFFTIDTFGRRALLLFTTPLLAIFLIMTGCAFYAPASSTTEIAIVLLGIYLYAMAYSPGFGPVPFTYSAEAYPLYIREVGMGYSTAVLWFFNALLAVTFFKLADAFTPSGAFFWYAGWNIVLFVLVLLFCPETKALTLEELDQVFSVPTWKHAKYQLGTVPHFIQKYIFRRDVEREPLYHLDPTIKRTKLPVGAAA